MKLAVNIHAVQTPENSYERPWTVCSAAANNISTAF